MVAVAVVLLVLLVVTAIAVPVLTATGSARRREERCPEEYRPGELRCLRPAGHPGQHISTSIVRDHGKPITGGEDVAW